MTTFGSTLKELSNEYAKKQPKQVNTIVEKAPILDVIPFVKATHGLWNVYENVTNITGASFVDMDQELPTLGTDSGLMKVDLGIMGGKIFVPEDRAKLMGGVDAYFSGRLPHILKASGMSAEVAIVYNNLRQYAIDNSVYTKCGGASNAGYSIIAVRFEEGACQGLYSPEGFKQGAMLDHSFINGKNLYENSSGILGYGLRLKGYFGIQLADPRCVGALVNIDASNKPTGDEIDDILARIRSDASGNTFLMMHPRAKAMLNSIKSANIQYTTDTNDINRRFEYWGGVKILTSYNFYEGTETNVA